MSSVPRPTLKTVQKHKPEREGCIVIEDDIGRTVMENAVLIAVLAFAIFLFSLLVPGL